MKPTVVILECLLLLFMLQATNDMGNATPAPIQCRDGDYAESEELCGKEAANEEEPASCSGGDCNNNDTENEVGVLAEETCPNCSKDLLTIQEAFNIADFVVRAKVSKTYLMEETENFVAVETMVRLVMKRRMREVTPGKLRLTVRIDRGWMCNCPGPDDLHINETYLITGFVKHTKRNKPGYELRVNHNSIVAPWSEDILDDMVKKRQEYHGLRFKPNLNQYTAFLPYYE